MRKNTLSNSCVLGALTAFALLIAATASAQMHFVFVSHEIFGPHGDSRAHVGDTVTMRLTVINVDGFDDSITVNSVLIVAHHGTGEVRFSNLAGNGVVVLPFEAAEFSTNFVVQPEDGDYLMVESAVEWTDNRDGPAGAGFPQVAAATNGDAVLVLKPAVEIFQRLRAMPGGQMIAFDGMVTNTGNTPLQNVVVLSDNATPQNPSDDSTITIPVLNPGCAVSFEGTYPAGASQPNTVSVRATDDLGLTVTSSNVRALPVVLSIDRYGSGSIQICWPSWVEGYLLESSDGIGGGWKVVNSHATLRNGQWCVILPITTNHLYRLRQAVTPFPTPDPVESPVK